MSFTYDSLKAAVTAVAEDSGTEFDSYFDTALLITQEKMVKDLDNFGLVIHAATCVSAGDYFITKPSGARAIKSLHYINASSEHVPLLLVTDEFIKDYWPVRTSTGTPKYYAPWDNNTVVIAPTPVSLLDYEMSYVVLPTAISSSMQTNWFTDFAGDALFYGVMVEMCFFARNKEMLSLWKSRYDEAIGALRNESRRHRRDDERQPASPTGENNLTE
jgi:hypothetical protein